MPWNSRVLDFRTTASHNCKVVPRRARIQGTKTSVSLNSRLESKKAAEGNAPPTNPESLALCSFNNLNPQRETLEAIPESPDVIHPWVVFCTCKSIFSTSSSAISSGPSPSNSSTFLLQTRTNPESPARTSLKKNQVLNPSPYMLYLQVQIQPEPLDVINPNP